MLHLIFLVSSCLAPFFLNFAWLHMTSFSFFAILFINFASRSSGKHNSESRSYAKAQKLAPFVFRQGSNPPILGPQKFDPRSLTFFGNAFRSAKHITFAHGPVQNRIRPILHQKCNLQNYASRSSQKHIFAKLLQTKIKTYTCKRKSKFVLHF